MFLLALPPSCTNCRTRDVARNDAIMVWANAQNDNTRSNGSMIDGTKQTRDVWFFKLFWESVERNEARISTLCQFNGVNRELFHVEGGGRGNSLLSS